MIIIVATWLSKVYFVNTVMVCSLCVGYFGLRKINVCCLDSYKLNFLILKLLFECESLKVPQLVY